MTRFFTMLLTLCLGQAALAQDFISPDYVLESYGVYCQPEGNAIKQAAPGTELGYILLTDADTTATVTTTRVPATLGLAFGVSLRLAQGQPRTIVEFRVTHPTATPGKRITEHWTTGMSSAGPSLNRFRFDYPKELRTGLWVMEVAQDNKVVFRQSFKVVEPDAAADILSQCAGFAPVS